MKTLAALNNKQLDTLEERLTRKYYEMPVEMIARKWSVKIMADNIRLERLKRMTGL